MNDVILDGYYRNDHFEIVTHFFQRHREAKLLYLLHLRHHPQIELLNKFLLYVYIYTGFLAR